MAPDFTIFIIDNWNLIKNNIGMFILFGVFVFFVSWTIHNYFIEKKLHNIPERDALQKQLSELKEENSALQKKLQRYERGELIQETFREKSSHETVGDVIKRNK